MRKAICLKLSCCLKEEEVKDSTLYDSFHFDSPLGSSI